MAVTATERAAMSRALELAAFGPVTGPNPRVGCVVLDRAGAVAGQGYHAGAGTPHAEVAALAAAGGRAEGGTAVVTLEPCDHTGRTGPCTEALLAARIRRVVVAMRDPHPLAQGGVETLRAAGVDVELDGHTREAAGRLNARWATAVARSRPYLVWKFAATLDGRSAAADGSSRWITSAAARRDVHAMRATCDAVIAGTGTVLADDARLTVRADDGTPAPVQPLRVVVGLRDLPGGSRVLDASARTLRLRTRDPAEVLRRLHEVEVRSALLEGGPTLAAAFWRAGFVDEVVAYLAPALLGAGTPAVGDLGIASMASIARLRVVDVTTVGTDVRITARAQEEVTADVRGTGEEDRVHRNR